MARATGKPTETNLGIPFDIEEERTTIEEESPLIIPGSEEDETYQSDPETEPSINKDLDAHKDAADLDHPSGSIRLKHLEAQVRALLENFVQGDNKAVLNEDLELNGDIAISGELDIVGAILQGGGMYAGIIEQVSNADGEYTIWSNRRVEMTMWGFILGNSVDWAITSPNNALPYPSVSSIESVQCGCTGYKSGSNPTSRHDTVANAGEHINGHYDGAYLDVTVLHADGSSGVLAASVRWVWQAHLVGMV